MDLSLSLSLLSSRDQKIAYLFKRDSISIIAIDDNLLIQCRHDENEITKSVFVLIRFDNWRVKILRSIYDRMRFIQIKRMIKNMDDIFNSYACK